MTLADRYDAFLFDLDGVVWRGDEPIESARDTIATLRTAGKRAVFVTNNSSRTHRAVAAKLIRMGVPTSVEDVVTSADAVASELRRIDLAPQARVHVCGSEGLVRAVAGARFQPTDETENVEAVVVGWHPKFTFEDLRMASDLARSGLPFVASNDDATYPSETGVLPGTGAILAAIEVASGRTATVVGKPRPELFRLALERAGVPAERALFCGDRPDTDITGARAAGIPCALVLTGVTTERELGTLREAPDEILDDLSDLLDPQLPNPRLERRDGQLIASDGTELAALDFSRTGKRASLRGVRVPLHLDQRLAWRVVRRMLVDALAGADQVEAANELRPYLERIGIEALPVT